MKLSAERLGPVNRATLAVNVCSFLAFEGGDGLAEGESHLVQWTTGMVGTDCHSLTHLPFAIPVCPLR